MTAQTHRKRLPFADRPGGRRENPDRPPHPSPPDPISPRPPAGLLPVRLQTCPRLLPVGNMPARRHEASLRMLRRGRKLTPPRRPVSVGAQPHPTAPEDGDRSTPNARGQEPLSSACDNLCSPESS